VSHFNFKLKQPKIMEKRGRENTFRLSQPLRGKKVSAMAERSDDPGRSTSSSPNLYHSIVEHAPEILVSLNAAGKILYVNPHTEKVLGYSRDEVEGRDIFDFLHPADLQRAAQEYLKTIQQPGEGVPSVLRIRDSLGEWVPFEIIANNCLDDPDTRAVIFT